MADYQPQGRHLLATLQERVAQIRKQGFSPFPMEGSLSLNLAFSRAGGVRATLGEFIHTRVQDRYAPYAMGDFLPIPDYQVNGRVPEEIKQKILTTELESLGEYSPFINVLIDGKVIRPAEAPCHLRINQEGSEVPYELVPMK